MSALRLRLTGPQLGLLRRAIVDAYGGSADSLEEINTALTDNFENRDVFKYVIVRQKFELQVGDLLTKANGQGWLPGLLSALQRHQPEAEELRSVVQGVLATVPAREALALAAGNNAESSRSELEAILPGSALVDLRRMQRTVRCVCRVDYADVSPPGVGTGFLIAPDVVLTNWHVVRRIQEAPENLKSAIAKELRFRFDLLDQLDAQESKGREASVSLTNGSPILRSSPPGGREIGKGPGEPEMDALDYALIKVDGRPGDDVVVGQPGETRGHLPLGLIATQPQAGSAVMVLQHPLRGELQFAIGTLLGFNGPGSRIKHTAATQRGSSGSPVLDSALTPIGLHNGTRLESSAKAQEAYNTAVPLAHIVRDLENAGMWKILQE